MADVTVKIFRDGKEVHSEDFTGPITAAQAKLALKEVEREWKGRLTVPGSNSNIAGDYQLIAGSTYYLHLKSQAGLDPSDIVSRLMSDGPTDLPGLQQLRDLLEKQLPVKPPITEEALHLLSPHIADQFTVGGGKLSTCISYAVLTSPRGRGEPVTASHVDVVLIRVLLALDDAQPVSQQLGLELQRDQADSTSQMTSRAASGRSLRPDLMLREVDTGRLLFRGEEKSSEHTLKEAIDDLTDKMGRWSELYYGTLDYLLSYAAGWNRLQFVALQRGSPAIAAPISPVYDLTNPDHRAEVVLAAFNLYTLLAAVKRSLPAYVLPAGKTVSEANPAGFKRTLYFCADQPRVIKRVNPWTKFRELFSLNPEWLKTVYQLTAQRAGLIHAVEEPLFEIAYQVELEPLGLAGGDATVRSEAELRQAAHGLLHGLDALHSVNFVHRDMRWPNTACDVTKLHYFLLDLELAAPADTKPPFNLKDWTTTTLVQGRYTTASDLHMLGQMLQKFEHMVTQSAGRQFVTLLARPAEQLAQDNVTAASLLRHEWLSCVGEHCREAGAQPNTFC